MAELVSAAPTDAKTSAQALHVDPDSGLFGAAARCGHIRRRVGTIAFGVQILALAVIVPAARATGKDAFL